MSIRAACQTFTWEMLGSQWEGTADDLVDAIAAGGYEGIEITDAMIGDYAERPADFAARIAGAGLELVAFACSSPSGFTEPAARADDLALVEYWLPFVAAFPGAVLSLGSATLVSEGDRSVKFDAAGTFYNAAGVLGRRAGVPVAIHPSSHRGTLLSSRADYDRILALTDPDLVGWVPDTGHMLRGGHDVLGTLAAHEDRIRYLHLKDADAAGHWTMLGSGACDIRRVVGLVAAAPNFNGWVVVEEESEAAAADPAAAVARDRRTLQETLA